MADDWEKEMEKFRELVDGPVIAKTSYENDESMDLRAKTPYKKDNDDGDGYYGDKKAENAKYESPTEPFNDYIDHLIDQASDNIVPDDNLDANYAKWLQNESYQTDISKYSPLIPDKFTDDLNSVDIKFEYISDAITSIDGSVDDIGIICNDAVDRISNVHEDLIAFMTKMNMRLANIEKNQAMIYDLIRETIPNISGRTS
jgi:hypothetical protein